MRGRLLLALPLAAVLASSGCDSGSVPPPDHDLVPVGVLGDSDSHSYGDSVYIGGPTARGGPYRGATLQWTEIWAKLRPDEVTLGPWGEWGTRGAVASMRRAFGLHGRSPPKRDFRFNMAVSGARCDALGQGMSRQVQPLVELMDRDPEWWSRGLVVIRIGVNSFGQPPHLDALARGDSLPAMAECAGFIRDAVAQIRAGHPRTGIALVGIFNNVHWARVTDRWQDSLSLRRISTALDAFDSTLVAMADADPAIAFHDDRAWMASLWGGRGEGGAPAYRSYLLEGGPAITNTVGDEPSNIVVADGHLGTAANALWLRSLIELVDAELGYDLTPITDQEIMGLIEDAEAWVSTPRPAARTP